MLGVYDAPKQANEAGSDTGKGTVEHDPLVVVDCLN